MSKHPTAGHDLCTQPQTQITSVLNVAYQDVMLWNGALGNASNGIINVGIDPDRLMTEGTPKEANREGLSGIETQAIAGTGVHRILGFPRKLPVIGHFRWESRRTDIKAGRILEPTNNVGRQLTRSSRSVRCNVIEIDDLVEFIEVSLRDPDLMRYEPTELPSGR